MVEAHLIDRILETVAQVLELYVVPNRFVDDCLDALVQRKSRQPEDDDSYEQTPRRPPW
jgi:hypothetical protein